MRNVWNAYHDMFRLALFHQPLQIGKALFVILSGVSLVDVRIHIFDVDNVLVDNGEQPFQMRARNIEGSFHVECPRFTAQLAELFDEFAPQTRFASTKSDAAFGGEKIKFVNLHLVVKQLRIVYRLNRFGREGVGIQAIFASQRATVKHYKRSDPFAIGRKTMPG